MKNKFLSVCCILLCVVWFSSCTQQPNSEGESSERLRVIVTSDGEIDDECSMIRFLLYANEWDIEAIITSSSQYHWRGHRWAGDDWLNPILDAYEEVYPNLVQHDKNYPTPEYLRTHTYLGNVDAEGEMDQVTDGSRRIEEVLLDRSDNRPVWIQAWGGTNTIARALKSIEEKYPDRMAEVAGKLRFFFIWEQDSTYQSYIRPHWGKYNILTIISDQFEAIAYRWKMVQPVEVQPYFEGPWMKQNILQGHGALCSLYKAHENGDFRSEGDSPAYLHVIPTGLGNEENPDWGGWGGRYVKVRENTWLDPVPVEGYTYPEGRWYGSNGWGRCSLRPGTTTTAEERAAYFRPMWMWSKAMQNDFAARADWCVKSYEEANHQPVVVLAHGNSLTASPGETVKLSASGTTDPDGDMLSYNWRPYRDASSYKGDVEVVSVDETAEVYIPADAEKGQTLHIICSVTDDGEPHLTRYQRVVIHIK